MAHQYGVVALERQTGRLNKMTGMVEKPPKGTEPSKPLYLRPLCAEPRDLRHPRPTRSAAQATKIQLTDAMHRLMASQDFYALEYEGTTLRLRRQDRLAQGQCGHGLEATRPWTSSEADDPGVAEVAIVIESLPTAHQANWLLWQDENPRGSDPKSPHLSANSRAGKQPGRREQSITLPSLTPPPPL